MKLNKDKLEYYRKLCELGFSKEKSALYTSRLFSKGDPAVENYYKFESNLDKYINHKLSKDLFLVAADELFSN